TPATAGTPPNLLLRNRFRRWPACQNPGLLRRLVCIFYVSTCPRRRWRSSPMSTRSVKEGRRPLTPWELPSLLTPGAISRRAAKCGRKERPHFAAILGFVYRNRFAVASQIQRRLSGALRSGRTARRHLEELESMGYLGVAPARGAGPLFPKVYYVTGRG